MIFTSRVTAITQERILPYETDNFFGDTSFLTYRFLGGKGESWSGETLKVPVTIAGNDNGGSFSGMSSVDVGLPETRTSMSFNLKAHRQSVTVSGLEKMANRGEERMVNMISSDMHTAFESMLARVTTQLYGDGTGSSGEAFLGLNALATDSTITSTVGGLSRSTYPTLNGQVADIGGNITLDDMSDFRMDLRSGSGAKNRPTAYVCGEAVWTYLEKLIVTGTVQANYQTQGYPQVTRNSKGAIRAADMSAGAGLDSILYGSTPIIYDDACPANVLWGLNENYLKFYGAKSDDLKSISIPQGITGGANDRPTDDIGLQWSGFKDAYLQFGEMAIIYLFGEFVVTQPRRQGKRYGITGV